MEKDPPDEPRRHFYDVEWFRRNHTLEAGKRGFASRFVGRLSRIVDSVFVFFALMSFVLVGFGAVGLVAVGFIFGPLVFWGAFAGTVGGLAFVVDRKVGKSIQFGDEAFVRRILGQVVGLSLALGFFGFLIFVLPRLIALHFP